MATFSLGDRDLAEDVGQEVAIRAIRSLGKLRDPERFDGWVYRISAAEIKRAARRRTTRQAEPLDTGPEGDQAADPAFPKQVSDRDWLLSALAELSTRQRIVVGLRYIHGLTDSEIATAIGSRPGTARSLLSRALARLRERAKREEASGSPAAGGSGPDIEMEVAR